MWNQISYWPCQDFSSQPNSSGDFDRLDCKTIFSFKASLIDIFSHALHALLYGWQFQSVSRSTTLVQTEISQQLLDRLLLNLEQTFMFPR